MLVKLMLDGPDYSNEEHIRFFEELANMDDGEIPEHES